MAASAFFLAIGLFMLYSAYEAFGREEVEAGWLFSILASVTLYGAFLR